MAGAVPLAAFAISIPRAISLAAPSPCTRAGITVTRAPCQRPRYDRIRAPYTPISAPFERREKGGGTEELTEYDVTRYLSRGRNLVAIRAKNTRGATAGLAARVLIREAGEDWVSYSTDETWKANVRALPLWNTNLYNDGRWPEACRCANVCLWNRHMQTFDYLNRQVTLNRRQTKLESDGSFRLVVAAEDPGVPNWLDTEGRGFGLVFFRYMLPEGEIETPRAKLVALSLA